MEKDKTNPQAGEQRPGDMKIFNTISNFINDHLQVVLGGVIFFVGKDLFSVAVHNFWLMQVGNFLQDLSLYVIGFKAVSETVKNSDTKP
jgi:hypothetical protein